MDLLNQLAFPSLSDQEYDKQLPMLQQQLARLQVALFLQKKRTERLRIRCTCEWGLLTVFPRSMRT